MTEPIKKLTRFTEQELKQRKIGTYANPEGTEAQICMYRTKVDAYKDEGVLKSYRSLYNSFKALLLREETASFNEPDKYASAKCAQILIDAYLFRRSRGHDADIPNKVHLYEVKKESEIKDGIELYDAELFDDKGSVSENEKVRWLFENMQVAGVEPSDAPSIGAYTMLMHLRSNAQAMQKFYDSSWLKLLAREDAQKTGKLEDTGKDTIDLIKRLQAALPESE